MNTLFFPESNKGKRLTVDILIYWEGNSDYQGFLGKRRRKNRIAKASYNKKALSRGLTGLPEKRKCHQEGWRHFL